MRIDWRELWCKFWHGKVIGLYVPSHLDRTLDGNLITHWRCIQCGRRWTQETNR